MRTSEEGLSLIRCFEGFSETAYICAGGYPTIGYGHVILAGEVFSEPINKARATALLRKDVLAAELGVKRHIQAALNQHQFDALVSFTFNLGSGALQRSTLRRVVNRGTHDDVPRELRRWVFAGGRKLRGLVRRRDAEAILYKG